MSLPVLDFPEAGADGPQIPSSFSGHIVIPLFCSFSNHGPKKSWAEESGTIAHQVAVHPCTDRVSGIYVEEKSDQPGGKRRLRFSGTIGSQQPATSTRHCCAGK